MAAGLKLKLKAGGEALYRQIEQAVREAIASGQLKPGERLPSAVDLAHAQRINKLTVVKAFQRLEKAGVVRSAVGRGTFVAAPAEGVGAAEVASDGPSRRRSWRARCAVCARVWRAICASCSTSRAAREPSTFPEACRARTPYRRT